MIEQLQALGLSMASRYAPVTVTEQGEDGEPVTATYQRHVCWTTDEAKATAAENLGATVTRYTSRDPACSGWEVTVREVLP